MQLKKKRYCTNKILVIYMQVVLVIIVANQTSTDCLDDTFMQTRSVQDFINHLRKNKIVYMEDLAAEFNMKTQV